MRCSLSLTCIRAFGRHKPGDRVTDTINLRNLRKIHNHDRFFVKLFNSLRGRS